ncbi:MAG TPA: agmatinase [Parafilimonas sp.]|nr:agmatinase [Parafilimonas sp.]
MIKLIGIPYDANSSFLRGPALAPARIRLMEQEGSANCFSETGVEIIDGTTYDDTGDISFGDISAASAFQLIKEPILKTISGGQKTLCLGGDHSVSFPIIDAFTEKFNDLNVLHLDAHCDLYQSFDNNPFSHASPFARIMEKGRVRSLTQVGIRTLNTHQREQAKRFNVSIVEMKSFSFNFIKALRSPLYISLDMDVLDPAFAPGVSHHEPGGLSVRDLISIIQNINAEVVGADIVEYNPNRDVNNVTAMAAYKLFKEMIALMTDQLK